MIKKTTKMHPTVMDLLKRMVLKAPLLVNLKYLLDRNNAEDQLVITAQKALKTNNSSITIISAGGYPWNINLKNINGATAVNNCNTAG